MVSPGAARCNCYIALVLPTGACRYHGGSEGFINCLGEGVDGAYHYDITDDYSYILRCVFAVHRRGRLG